MSFNSMIIVERRAVERRNGQDGGRRSVLLIDDVITPVLRHPSNQGELRCGNGELRYAALPTVDAVQQSQVELKRTELVASWSPGQLAKSVPQDRAA